MALAGEICDPRVDFDFTLPDPRRLLAASYSSNAAGRKTDFSGKFSTPIRSLVIGDPPGSSSPWLAKRQGWTSGPSARKRGECEVDVGSERLSSAFSFAYLSQDRPAVFAKATPGQGGSVPAFFRDGFRRLVFWGGAGWGRDLACGWSWRP